MIFTADNAMDISSQLENAAVSLQKVTSLLETLLDLTMHVIDDPTAALNFTANELPRIHDLIDIAWELNLSSQEVIQTKASGLVAVARLLRSSPGWKSPSRTPPQEPQKISHRIDFGRKVSTVTIDK